MLFLPWKLTSPWCTFLYFELSMGHIKSNLSMFYFEGIPIFWSRKQTYFDQTCAQFSFSKFCNQITSAIGGVCWCSNFLIDWGSIIFIMVQCSIFKWRCIYMSHIYFIYEEIKKRNQMQNAISMFQNLLIYLLLSVPRKKYPD